VHYENFLILIAQLPTNILTHKRIAMEKNSRLLTVSESAKGDPKILLTGVWVNDWGFTIGDRISVTKTDRNEITIKLDTPSAQWKEIRRKKLLQNHLMAAESEIDYHRSKYPNLYDEKFPAKK
jgi:hypothetical protein